jgi:hypothetical protein
MREMIVQAYAVGQRPDEQGTARYLTEMPVGAKAIGAMFLGDQMVINAVVPRYAPGPKVLHNLTVVTNDDPIPLLIGEELGDLIETLVAPGPGGAPQVLHVFPIGPWPTSSLLAN